MNRYRKWLLLVAICVILAYSGSADAVSSMTYNSDYINYEENTDQAQEKPYVEGQVLVMYEENVMPGARSVSGIRFHQDMQVEETYSFAVEQDSRLRSRSVSTGAVNLCVSLVKSDRYTTEELMEILSEDSSIRYVEPNFKMHMLTNDYMDYQWALKNTGNNAGIEGLDMNPDVVADMDLGDTQEKVIAIVDTGVDYTHPDLADKMWKNPFEAAQLKGTYGYDFSDTRETDPMDDNGHGTHCAGVAAGNDDGNGITGIATSDNIKIMAIKVMDSSGACDSLSTVGAYNYIYRAQQMGVNVVAVNNSWGVSMPMDAYWRTRDGIIPEEGIMKELMKMVGEKGALSCCAAGNEDRDTDDDVSYPANIDSPYVISVAACDERGNKTTFSNYGKTTVDVAAPGADILSSVSYDSFYPTIYSEEQREELCQYMNSMEGEEEQAILQTLERVNGASDLDAAITEEQYLGSGSVGHSLAFMVEEGKKGTWYIPYDAPQGQGDYYISADVKMNDEKPDGRSYVYLDTVFIKDGQSLESVRAGKKMSGEAGNYWKHFQWKVNDTNDEDGKRYLVIQTSLSNSKSATVYLDNLGISKRVEDTSVFGKYDLKNGTSMATPFVTGAAAVIAQIYPNADALERRDMLLSACRKMDSLKGVCATEGMVDLAMLKNPELFVEKLELDEEHNIIIKGNVLKDAQVTCNGEAANVISSEDKAIILDGKAFENENVAVVITKGENRVERGIFVPKAKKMEQYSCSESVCSATRFVTDGEMIYGIGNYGEIHVCKQTDEGDIWEEMTSDIGNNLFDVSFSQSTMSNVMLESNPVVLNGSIYCLVKLESGDKTHMMVASVKNGEKWQPVQNVPEACLSVRGMTLAAYNDNLYLLGGYDEEQEVFVSDVYQLNKEELSWSKIENMPQERGFASAVQVGKKLIVTMGAGGDEGTFPHNMIWDGETWSVSEAELHGEMTTKVHEGKKVNNSQENSIIEYYAPNVVLIDGGLLYQGMNVAGLGNIFTYNVDKDCFEEASFADDNENLQRQQGVVVVGDELQLYRILPMKGVTEKYCAKVANGYIEAKITGLEMAEISGVRTWLPCDKIDICISAKKNTYVDCVMLNGEPISTEDSPVYIVGKASDYPEGISIEGKMYVYIEKLQVAEKQEVFPGKSVALSVVPEPATQVKEEYKWESDNEAVATVDASGKVKVAATAKAGDVAVITVTAVDQGKVNASCKVVVVGEKTPVSSEVKVPTTPTKKNPVPLKGSTKVVGKLVYKVTTSDEVSGTVSCVKMSKDGYASISIPETITWDGYTFKVTAIGANAFKSSKKLKSVSIGKNVRTIGKNAFRSCKLLKKVTIQSTRIKKIEKNVFYSVHKKCYIKIPKKKKKQYTKLLKKSGYKYRIKY